MGLSRASSPFLTGCGTQHPHRALGGTCVLLAAAPTTPPCFRHWRRSSSLLRIFSGRIIYNFAILENLRIFQNCLFTGGVWNELPQSKPDGFASSLWEGAFGMAVQFPAKPQSFRACPLPLGGAVAQRLRGFKSAEPEKTVKRSSRRTGVNLQFFPVGAYFFGIVKGE